jgi:YVTN family beta-propeller protein
MANIPVGDSPTGIAVSPNGSKVYVTNGGILLTGNTVSVINTASNSLSATIAVGNSPYGIIVSPDGSKVYVTNTLDGTVSVIRTATDSILTTIPGFGEPEGLSESNGRSRVYVANNGLNTVSVIDTATNAIEATIIVGQNPIAFGNFISTATVGIPSLTPASPSISIYPNPANTILNIHSQLTIDNCQLIITDVMGNEVYRETLPAIINCQLSIVNWNAGIYFYEIRGVGTGLQIPTNTRGKFIKE